MNDRESPPWVTGLEDLEDIVACFERIDALKDQEVRAAALEMIRLAYAPRYQLAEDQNILNAG